MRCNQTRTAFNPAAQTVENYIQYTNAWLQSVVVLFSQNNALDIRYYTKKIKTKGSWVG